MSYCVKCIVKGKVQGVFYRDTTRSMAHQLGLQGHAFNLLNGDVEVVACGKKQNVKRLQEWLWRGPEHAIVNDIICEEVTGDVEGGFEIG